MGESRTRMEDKKLLCNNDGYNMKSEHIVEQKTDFNLWS